MQELPPALSASLYSESCRARQHVLRGLRQGTTPRLKQKVEAVGPSCWLSRYRRYGELPHLRLVGQLRGSQFMIYRQKGLLMGMAGLLRAGAD